MDQLVAIYRIDLPDVRSRMAAISSEIPAKIDPIIVELPKCRLMR